MVSKVSAVDGSKSSQSEIVPLDPVWVALREEAQAIIDNDPAMSSFVFGNVLNQKSLEDAVVHRICERLHQPEFSASMIRDVFNEMRADWPEWSEVRTIE